MDSLNLLKQLIACPSITPKSAGSLALIEGILADVGFTTTYMPSGDVENLWAYKGQQTKLLFAGHVDVVPVGDIAQWKTDPFTSVEKEGHLYGRGAADMKSGVAAFVAAVVNQPNDGLGVFLTSDEEGAAIDGTKHFVKWWQSQQKNNIPYVLIGEPTSGKLFGDTIKIGRRGSLTAAITIQGKQEHVAYAHYRNNSATMLIEALLALQNQFRTNADKQEQGIVNTTFQIVELNAGLGVSNVTPPTASATINYRHALDNTSEQLIYDTEKTLQSIAPNQWRCKWTISAEPYKISEQGHLIQTLQTQLSKQLGRTAELSMSGGVSDGRFLREISDELIEFGVLNQSIHAPNENVNSADVLQLQKLYESLIQCI